MQLSLSPEALNHTWIFIGGCHVWGLRLFPVAVTFRGWCTLVCGSQRYLNHSGSCQVLYPCKPLKGLEFHMWLWDFSEGVGILESGFNWRPFSESSCCILWENGTESSLLGRRDWSWGAGRLGLSKKKKSELFCQVFQKNNSDAH